MAGGLLAIPVLIRFETIVFIFPLAILSAWAINLRRNPMLWVKQMFLFVLGLGWCSLHGFIAITVSRERSLLIHLLFALKFSLPAIAPQLNQPKRLSQPGTRLRRLARLRQGF